MQYTLFGAIDIGSSEMELKIFELSRGKGMREIDCIRNRLELGKDTYATGKDQHGEARGALPRAESISSPS